MLLGLVGVSGVGKTYFKEKIVQELGFQAVNTIRTREKRIGEENGKTGLFKTEEELFLLFLLQYLSCLIHKLNFQFHIP